MLGAVLSALSAFAYLIYQQPKRQLFGEKVAGLRAITPRAVKEQAAGAERKCCPLDWFLVQLCRSIDVRWALPWTSEHGRGILFLDKEHESHGPFSLSLC